MDPEKQPQDEEAEPDGRVEQQRKQQEAITREPGGERQGDQARKAERARRPACSFPSSYRCESKRRSGPGVGGGSIAAASGKPDLFRRHLRAGPQGLLGRRSLWLSARVPGPEVREAPRKG